MFVHDIMTSEPTDCSRVQYRCLGPDAVSVGYLRDDFVPGTVPDGFVERLERMMITAGFRLQTKGITERGEE
ncbi:hypothetical protein A2368_00295 [Candidatus Collierbacteria bacterium RIFOXYB1_FULL_49_13]|uniref:Uncharacterized protein n=1 Tax=Candidatus Collierbacteria bacterium RIFOXYB1_FULL_49_13 TaxID=1817728 RepID=A0A1F5FEK1_9BACT|nr:MAG: hypothetical protein A2368_00295 [Candidatus Collierbacteria bacterium RIFOXYB1_FULL_49_13]